MSDLSVQEERESYFTRHKMTVEEFHRMGEAGVLPPDARIELFEGELLDMPPIGPAHANHVDHLTRLFAPLARSVILRVQNPLRIGRRSELLPDVMLLKDRPGGYPNAAPGPEAVILLIEVSDTTLRYDRDDKLKLYAQHGVPESWLLDLQARQLEIYLQPGPNGYRQRLLPLPDQVVSPSLVPAFQIQARALFPG
jgi:Uma2 family endonuclease